jgi:pimeloyl-ACP methyl ester carboxylesterase
MREWIETVRGLAGRFPRRYSSVDEAVTRMQDANPHLSQEQARHLTIHGTNQNEDGTYSWKFDNYARAFSPYAFNAEEAHSLWGRITRPTLLIRGSESWASDPNKDGRASFFPSARAVNIDGAGHWVHHDQLDQFIRVVREFLAE